MIANSKRNFAAAADGIAAVEFGLVLPMLTVLFLTSIDAGRALAVYMKVRAATYTLNAITNQYSTIQSTDMTDITGIVSLVLAPYPTSSTQITVSQIKITSATSATVNWSATQNGTALTKNSSFTVPSILPLVVHIPAI